MEKLYSKPQTSHHSADEEQLDYRYSTEEEANEVSHSCGRQEVDSHNVCVCVCVHAHASSCFDLFKKTSLNAEIMQWEVIWDKNVIMSMV